MHIADAMTIAGVKNFEMSKDKQSYKGRIVYRGDAVRDQLGYPAIFKELHSLPTNVQAVNLTSFLGLVPGWKVQAADACSAFKPRWNWKSQPGWCYPSNSLALLCTRSNVTKPCDLADRSF